MPHYPLADQFFLAITWAGSLHVLLPCTALLSFVFHARGKRFEAQLLAAGMGLAILSTHALKMIVRRPRPDVDTLLIPMPSDWSFPSAHSAQAAAFFLALAMIACRNLPRAKAIPAVAVFVLAVLVVGYSRIYLQVHYVTDVFGGIAMGGFAVLVARIAAEKRDKRQGSSDGGV